MTFDKSKATGLGDMLEGLFSPTANKVFKFFEEARFLSQFAYFLNVRLAHAVCLNDNRVARIFDGFFIIDIMLDTNSKVLKMVQQVADGISRIGILVVGVSKAVYIFIRMMMQFTNYFYRICQLSVFVRGTKVFNSGFLPAYLLGIVDGEISHSDTKSHNNWGRYLPRFSRHQKPSSVSMVHSKSSDKIITTSSVAPNNNTEAYNKQMVCAQAKNNTTFDKTKATGLLYAAYRNSGIGFRSLNHEGERFCHLNIVGGFFVPCFHQLVDWVREAFACWVYLCDQSSNPHSVRLFSFRSESGGYSQGASL